MTAYVQCTESTVRQVEELAKQLHTLVCRYRWITESYVVEFFVKDHWGHLSPSWQQSLASLTPPDIAETLLMKPTSTPRRTSQSSVWPLSLLAFRAATLFLALPRTVTQPAKLHPQSGRNPNLSHCYRAHVKPKKQHEIECLAEVIHTTCKQLGCGRVVDVGSGQGHLSRLLSFGYGHQVTSIEAVDYHITGAAKFDQEVRAYFERKARANEAAVSEGIASPHHVVCTVHPYITVEEFLSVISARTQSNQGDGQSHSVSRVECMTGKPVHKVKKLKMDSKESDAGKCERIKEHENCGRRLADRCTNDEQPGFAQSNQSESRETISNPSGPSTFKILMPVNAQTEDSGTSSNPDSCQDHITIQTECSHCLTGERPQSEPFLVTGLHTCGDLGPTMLRTFAECPQAVALASVACCYMRMSFCDKTSDLHSAPGTPSPNDDMAATNPSSQNPGNSEFCGSSSEDSQDRLSGGNKNSSNLAPIDKSAPGLDAGFPMSMHVKSLCREADSMLTFEPLELACHFIEGYQARLKDNDPSLLTQGYRAALEVLIQEQCPNLNQSQEGARRIRKAVGSVKRAHQMTFQDYASTILSKLGLQSDPGRICTIGETLLPQWHNLLTYHSIRQLLAPIIESLVLLDRALFLYEKGIESSLVPIFDPLLSPRNLVLLAIKKTR
ncbi:protein RRNAD1-like [Patiria miniata]|uniref:Methyltransferase domain-containing protein n=1 Tax=Patiria miniata TaxID=46514 RepID=A0A914BSV9_PATMI|nr:protein RRNAD1-like [Patiria miniata]